MKFLKISAENFNGVAARTIDLEGTPYATVIGANGAGKSTMFVDAPLFALFGRAAVREDLASVVMRGEETAVVEFTFELGGEIIRVKRTYSIRTKTGAQSLDVWRDGVQVNGATMTETQKLLDQIAGCSFEVMVMGAVMRQGESDRFARCTPAERLRLLGALLGAERYREAKIEASQRLRDSEGTIRADVSRLAEMQELGPQLAELVVLQATLQNVLENQNRNHQAETTAREALVGELAAPMAPFAGDGEIDRLRAELGVLVSNLSAPTAAFAGERELETLRAELEAMVAKHRDKFQKATAQNREIEQTLAQRETLKQLAARDNDAVASLKSKRPNPAGLAEIGERGKLLAAEAVKLDAHVVELTAKVEDFRQRETEFTRKAIELGRQSSALGLRPEECVMNHCGLIKSAVAAKKDLDRLVLEPYVGDFTAESESLGLLARAAKETTEKVEAARAEYLALQTEIKGFDGRMAELEDAAKASTRRLTEGPIVTKSVIDLDLLSAGFSAVEHSVKDSIAKIVAAETAFVAEAAQKRAKARSSVEATEAAIRSLVAEGAAFAAQECGKIKAKIEASDAIIRDLVAVIRETERSLAGGAARRDEIEKQIDKGIEIKARVAAAQDQINLLGFAVKFLTVAPQIVVERALPVIEAVANEVLDQIQPGATIEVRQSRETKAGAVKDEVGVMCIVDGYEAPLATFSGGERFRIDLALRLGIAAASGAKLETLVIDEGWGSQDADKLEQVKEAIAALTTRFPRIYTISHVLAVEDMFGSIIRV